MHSRYPSRQNCKYVYSSGSTPLVSSWRLKAALMMSVINHVNKECKVDIVNIYIYMYIRTSICFSLSSTVSLLNNKTKLQEESPHLPVKVRVPATNMLNVHM